MGRPLMPWQRSVADVALEVDGRTGRLAYRSVVVLTPRQSGKTSLTLPLMTHRALAFGGNQRVLFGQQTRSNARVHWEDEQLPILEASPLARLFRVRKRTGAEAVLWRTGSIQSLLAPTESGAHGRTTDLVVLDESWAFPDATVEQAIAPTQVTRPEPQTWITSTAGTVRSEWLRNKVDAGRAAAESGRVSSTAYFEWAAPPGVDLADPAAWWQWMPALGHTITEAAVQAEYDRLDIDDFARAYGNLWPDERPVEEWAALNREVWGARGDPAGEMLDPVALAVDVSPDRKWASIGAAGDRADGRRQVELVDHRPGTSWVAERVAEIVGRHEVLGTVVDGGGPAASLVPALSAAGVEVHTIGAQEVARACGALRDGLADGTLVHLDQPALTAAAAGARLRPLGEAHAWARRGSDVVVSPLVATGHALYGHAVLPREERFAWTAF